MTIDLLNEKIRELDRKQADLLKLIDCQAVHIAALYEILRKNGIGIEGKFPLTRSQRGKAEKVIHETGEAAIAGLKTLDVAETTRSGLAELNRRIA